MQVKTIKITIAFPQPVAQAFAESIVLALGAVLRLVNAEPVFHLLFEGEEVPDAQPA